MEAETEVFSEIVSEQESSTGSSESSYGEESASVTRFSVSSYGEAITEFSIFIEKLTPLLDEIKNNKTMNSQTIQKAVESLEAEFHRAKHLISSPSVRSSPAKQIEDVTQNLGRSLGLVLFASRDMSMTSKEKIDGLRREMMNLSFGLSSESGTDFFNDVITGEDAYQETEIVGEIVEEEAVPLDVNDVIFRLSSSNDEEFDRALMGLDALVRHNMFTSDVVDKENITSILCSRLNLCESRCRLAIFRVLRSLMDNNVKNKEKMEDVRFLSALVKSLTRDVEERREAVRLLSDLSDVQAVRKRIGRIQGCILMLVSIFNGDDEVASHDALRVLNSLSSNSQYALNMAEACYFKPLIQYLKQGSDMSKVLMATALSRMVFTDQSKASIGEDGAIEALVKLFENGNLEAKLSALNALLNLSSLKENVQRLFATGIVGPLLQLLFSVTSVLMTLREPASAILAVIANSENMLLKHNVAQQMLSLLNLTSPVIQGHLLNALNSIVRNSSAAKVRRKLKENGAIELLSLFVTDRNTKIRISALQLICLLSDDEEEELIQQLGETNTVIIAGIISSSVSEEERAAALGILSKFPETDKRATEILKNTNLLPILVSMLSSVSSTSTPFAVQLSESISGVLIRFTTPSDKNLQRVCVEYGAISGLIKLLSNGSALAKSRAAKCLSQLSQNSVSLSKSRKSKWLCMHSSVDSFCEVHGGYCSVKSTFCLVKADAVPRLVRILESNEREAHESVLSSLSTLLQDEIWEKGSNLISKCSGVVAILNVLESGKVTTKERAIWMLERIFRVEAHRTQHGESAQRVLIDLAQHGDSKLKPSIARLLAQLEILQIQSSYF